MPDYKLHRPKQKNIIIALHKKIVVYFVQLLRRVFSLRKEGSTVFSSAVFFQINSKSVSWHGTHLVGRSACELLDACLLPLFRLSSVVNFG